MNFVRSFAAVAIAAAALAANHAQAQTLIGGGKSVSFPIVISQPGSYQLAGNLVVGDFATTAIKVMADNVTIDLNGYSISGPNVCSATNKTCTATNGGYGILTSVVRGLTVRNGTINGFGAAGISAGPYLRVENLSVVNNGMAGITAGGSAMIDRVVARSNGPLNAFGAAIQIDDGMVTNSEASFNIGSGFRHGHLINVSANNNGGFGVFGQASFISLQQSRIGMNVGGYWGGSVTSFGNNFCGMQIC